MIVASGNTYTAAIVVAADNEAVALDGAAGHGSASGAEGALGSTAEGAAGGALDALEDRSNWAGWALWAGRRAAGDSSGGEESDNGDDVGELHFDGFWGLIKKNS
ncbi:hypothetical protein PAAG_11076 [Paracoccidioides lutzii Pb01]|uniref:Uncharacterized protein n=1 Tax=Paracoccidioides lutzii (strain ATCC MYA-826 / Pb01) TaxID=502779 RepID=A0A0A2V7S1_PARBA|nr:hypothetical protein PAAG_11076 [Paracoccidioides lutzii Pb01]KGQ02125.1 hypothetical protein PAAG_11076 [Paracoccidioides lutzii Pb01]